MRQFPIQHRHQAIGGHQEIAGTEIAVDDICRRPIRHPFPQPGKGEIEHRRIDAKAAIVGEHAIQRLRRAARWQGQPVGNADRQLMQPGQHIGALARHRGARRGIFGQLQPFRRQRLARQPGHHIGFAQAIFRCQHPHHFGYGQAALKGALLKPGLIGTRQAAFGHGTGGSALQDQWPGCAIGCHGINGKGGRGRPARQLLHMGNGGANQRRNDLRRWKFLGNSHQSLARRA